MVVCGVERDQHGSVMEQPKLRESTLVKADENLAQFTPLLRVTYSSIWLHNKSTPDVSNMWREQIFLNCK